MVLLDRTGIVLRAFRYSNLIPTSYFTLAAINLFAALNLLDSPSQGESPFPMDRWLPSSWREIEGGHGPARQEWRKRERYAATP